jgi:hypothetical protein
MAPGGCLLVLLGLAAFTAILAGTSAYFFYRNFGQKLFLVRDEIQPVGERFLHLLDDESYQAAYAHLSDKARQDWPPEKFGVWAMELKKSLGRLQEFSVLAQPTVDYVTQNKNDELNDVPMYFPCRYTDGGQSFILTFHKLDGVWQIDKIRVTAIGKEIEMVPLDQREQVPAVRKEPAAAASDK